MRSLVVLLALTSCVDTNTVQCASGRLCPEGHVCDDTRDRCIAPGAIEACSGLVDGESCISSGLSGRCIEGICTSSICGDGVRSTDELCEGLDLGGTTCADIGYYDTEGLACTPFCTFDVSACTGYCGDHIVNGGELCDGELPVETCYDIGYDAGSLACSTGCAANVDGCTRFGFRPQYVGFPITDIDGLSLDDLWVVGTGGRAAHLENNAWVRHDPHPADELIAVRVVAPDQVWALSIGSLERWNGTAWSTVTGVPAGTYTSLWAGGPNALVIGTTTGVLAWDGTMWRALGSESAAVAAVDATSLTDIWAGFPDDLKRWNGSAWTTMHPATILGIHIVAPDQVWIAGREQPDFSGSAIAAFYDGQTWTDHVFTDLTEVSSVTASADNEAWVTHGGAWLKHYNGIEWAEVTSVGELQGQTGRIIGFGAGEIAGAALTGIAYRFRGQAFVQWGQKFPTRFVKSMWSNGFDAMFVGGRNGRVYRRTPNNSWVSVQVSAMSIDSVWGTSASAVWAAAGDRVYAYDGTSWTDAVIVGVATTVVGTSATDVWALGAGQAHFDGTTWEVRGIPNTVIEAASQSAPDNLWALSSNTGAERLWRWNGSAWSEQVPAVPGALDVVTFSPTLTYVLTERAVHRWDGATWTEMPILASIELTKIVASAPDDIVVYSPREMFHYDGVRWSPVRVPRPTGGNYDVDAVSINASYIDFGLGEVASQYMWSLLRVRPWNCRASETACADGVDDDCDGQIDDNDSDCP